MTNEVYDNLMEDRGFAWYQTASQQDKQLGNKVYEFENLFGDMVFSEGSSTHEFISCMSKVVGTDNWIDDETPLPDEIAFFSYGFFTYHVENLDGSAGRFIPKEYSLIVDPAYINDNSVILHEMIHLHEFVIDGLPLFFHDAILFCIYKDLKSKIPNLDDRIEAHGHILNSSLIARQGGTHDILFLLKSFDLDLKMGYSLGTVFGYGMSEQLADHKDGD